MAEQLLPLLSSGLHHVCNWSVGGMQLQKYSGHFWHNSDLGPLKRRELVTDTAERMEE